MIKSKPKIVCIGGGTGTFVVLRGLKDYPFHLTAIITMSDSGGCNKRLRDEFGLLPTSDIRQCLVALSEENGGIGLLRKLFMYRFQKGKGITGMTFGSLFMAALTDILGSQEKAISQTGKVLCIHGTVIPVSFTKTNLWAEYENDEVLKEEHLIDEPPHDGSIKITKVYLKPKARANPDALLAIRQADYIILGPGDLYTSVLANLLVDNICEAITKSRAKIIYITNLMTKYGQTQDYKASDHINIIGKYIGKSIDYIILNNGILQKKALSIYAKYKEKPVIDDLDTNKNYRVVKADVVSRIMVKKSSSDNLVRSLIRHDSRKLAKVLYDIIVK